VWRAAAAVLQCLSHTPALVQYLTRGLHSKRCNADGCVTCAFERHLLAAERSGGAPIRPSNVVNHLRSIGRRLRLGQQEDAHEFLRLLLDSFHKSELKIRGLKESDARALVEDTFVHHIFGGYFRNQIRSARCVCCRCCTCGQLTVPARCCA
jgi:ubiquitin carboxyl-terminal hydrolase 36/42